MAVVLVVDPDSEDRGRVSEQLMGAGHEVHIAASGAEVLHRLQHSGGIDLILTEWHLPDMQGLDLLEQIRQLKGIGDIRTIMISHRGEPDGVARALEAGVEDFVAKPIRFAEFMARVNAVLRRPPTPAINGILRVGPMLLDRRAHKLVVKGTELSLAPVELRLISFFMEHPGEVMERRELLERVWRRSPGIGLRTVDVHVRRLRAALEPHQCASLIQTIRGFGYRFG